MSGKFDIVSRGKLVIGQGLMDSKTDQSYDSVFLPLCVIKQTYISVKSVYAVTQHFKTRNDAFRDPSSVYKCKHTQTKIFALLKLQLLQGFLLFLIAPLTTVKTFFPHAEFSFVYIFNIAAHRICCRGFITEDQSLVSVFANPLYTANSPHSWHSHCICVQNTEHLRIFGSLCG